MLFILLFLLTWPTTQEPMPCKAHIELRQENGMLTVIGHCRNLLTTAGRYRYEMALTRESNGGRSKNTQGGEFEAGPQQDVSLSRASVNISVQDAYRINLRIMDLAGHVVAQDSAIQGSNR